MSGPTWLAAGPFAPIQGRAGMPSGRSDLLRSEELRWIRQESRPALGASVDQQQWRFDGSKVRSPHTPLMSAILPERSHIMISDVTTESNRIRRLFRERFTFQISVDTPQLPQGLAVAEAALKAGVTILELGTPLLKYEGVRKVVPIFRQRFPQALLLADMKTMDGGEGEANAVYGGGGNVIDFLALAGEATARAVCAVRDTFRASDPATPRLAFADVLVPMQGPAGSAAETAERMLAAGVDGVGIHLQYDARRADPALFRGSYLHDVAAAVFQRVGGRASVQVVGGLSAEQAVALARKGLRAFVISGNLGLPDAQSRYGLPDDEIERHIRDFIAEVSAAG
jgi:3-hexulose-6-phosphate synthase